MPVRVASEAVAAALRRAASREHLGALWAVEPTLACRAADQVDARAARGEHVPLAGFPVAVKACFDVKGLPTSAGVEGADLAALADALLVKRLLRAGSVPIGKTAMDQLGWATCGRASGRARVVNPLDAGRSPGGSSAGSAAAIAAGIVELAIGSDAAGSTRVPAAYCGVVGFKPAPRALPRAGSVRIAPSFEAPGLLAASVAVCRRAYEAATGRTVGGHARPLRVGLLEDLFEAASPVVASVCRGAVIGSGLTVDPAHLGWRPAGFGRVLASDLVATWGPRIDRHPSRFTAAVRESAAFGRTVRKAERREILVDYAIASRRLSRLLATFDVLASPTVPHPVPRAGAESVDESTRFTRPFNALGWPAISIPCGRDGHGMPIGLQLAALPARVGELLRVAEIVESRA